MWPCVTLLHRLLDLGSIACNQIVRDDELGKSRSADELASAGICSLNHPGQFGSADRSAGNIALCLQLWVETLKSAIRESQSIMVLLTTKGRLFPQGRGETGSFPVVALFARRPSETFAPFDIVIIVDPLTELL